MYKILPILLFAYGLAITTDEIYDDSWALIIGIDKYQNVANLDYAVKDAESIQDILVNTFDFSKENITLLKNEQATKQNIINSFSEINMNAKEGDRILIFFAGHGATEDLPNGGELGYLLPVDGTMDNLFNSSISMKELGQKSLLSTAKHILYLVDACYGVNDEVVETKSYIYSKLEEILIKKMKSELNNGIEKISYENARQIITAGGRGEFTIEKDEWGHSAFTKNLILGLKEGKADLNNDGFIIANELATFLRISVSEDSEYLQMPQSARFTSGQGEFIFSTSKVNSNNSESELLEKGQEINTNYTFDNIDSIMDLYTDNPMIFKTMDNEELIRIIEISAKKRKKTSNKINTSKLDIDSNKFYENSFAVIIGINKYTISKPLKYAVNDALEINNMLTNKFGFKNKNIRLLLDNDATYISIRQALYEIGKLANGNDRILIYFAGHGTQISTNSGMKIGYLIPSEGNINEPLLGGIPMDDFLRMCQLSKSKHILFLMDACYSGLMAEGTRGLAKPQKEEGYIATVSNIPARQIITAGDGKQEVLEADEWQHSAFTHNLLKALNDWEADGYKDGYITATELGEYLKKTVADETQGRQTPQAERIKASKGGEFIFFR